MSRIGRLPIDIPAGVEVKIEEGNKVTVKGPKGTLEKCLPVEMTIKQEDNQVVVTRAQKKGKEITFNLGFSHPVVMTDPEGIETEMDGQNIIIVKGIDKEKVGQYAAEIRELRKPEPYKGKGIKYADEVIRRKVGKTGAK